jgi:hypothetical protein
MAKSKSSTTHYTRSGGIDLRQTTKGWRIKLPHPPRAIDWSEAEWNALLEELDRGGGYTEVGARLSARVGRNVTNSLLANKMQVLVGAGYIPPARPSPKAAQTPVERRNAQDQAAKSRAEVESLVDQLKEAQARQSFLDAAAGYHAPPRLLPREKASGVRELAACVLASDWHVEEPVDPEAVAYRNEYNLEIASERIDRFFQGIIWNIEHHRASKRIAIRDLILWLGGDFITGYIHPELVESNQLSPTEALRWLMPRLRDGIWTLLKRLELDHFEIPCSRGNHGRTTDKTRIATGAQNSFEWLMYHTLASEFRDEKRVHFEITTSAHQYVDVYSQIIHYTHGDEVKYMGGVGGLGIPLLKAVPMWDRVKPADIHCLGHHHTLRDYGRAIVNGSLIGYNAFAQSIRAEFEPPQQAMFYVDKERGKAMVTALWVADLAKQKGRGVK